MAPKRVVIFSFVYYPRFIGGAELAVREITDRTDSEEIEFHLIALRIDRSLPTREKIGNVTVHRIGFSGDQTAPADSLPFRLHLNKYLYPFLAARAAARLHRESHFDMSWAIMANYSGFGALFFKLFHMDVPFLLTLQEGDPIDYILSKAFRVHIGSLKVPVRWFMLPVFRMIFTHADRIQAISNYLADFGRSMDPRKSPEQIVVVPNGVDIERFSAPVPAEEMEAIRREIGKAPGDIFLVTASRLVVKNAVGDIISSLSHLPPNVKLLVLGQGYQEAELKALSERLGLGERVAFRGFVGHEELPAYLKACDIFVRPSISEGFGNSFVEAMAAGLPVIATRVGGIVDFLRDKETGLFCDVNAPMDIARKAEIYIHDRALREEIVDNALHMVVDHYDWKTIAKDIQEKAFDPLLVQSKV